MSIPLEERKTIFMALAGAALCAALVWVGLSWPELLIPTGVSSETEIVLGKQKQVPAHTLQPLGEVLKLVVAAALGMLITAVHKRFHRDKPMTRSMEQAQILLCISGALMMIIINSAGLAGAFGIAGAAGIIRFRTPVEDPKDVTILFLLIGLGMSVGLGAIAVAAMGSAFLCFFLFVLDRLGGKRQRMLMLVLEADGPEFPAAHVQNLFAAYGIVFEPREISKLAVRYQVTLGPNVSLEYLSDQLLSAGYSGIKSVTWEAPKKRG